MKNACLINLLLLLKRQWAESAQKVDTISTG